MDYHALLFEDLTSIYGPPRSTSTAKESSARFDPTHVSLPTDTHVSAFFFGKPANGIHVMTLRINRLSEAIDPW